MRRSIRCFQLNFVPIWCGLPGFKNGGIGAVKLLPRLSMCDALAGC
jgi:hypothetical protein